MTVYIGCPPREATNNNNHGPGRGRQRSYHPCNDLVRQAWRQHDHRQEVARDWVAVKELKLSYRDEYIYSNESGFPNMITKVKFCKSI